MKSKAIIVIVIIAALFIGTIIAVVVPWGRKNNGEYIYRAFSDHVELIEYIGDGYDVTVPDEIDGLPVTIVGSGTFKGNVKLEKVTLGNNVTELGTNAFRGCTTLSDVVLDHKLETLGSGCFANCTSLSYFNVPSTVTAFEGEVFYGCTGLTRIILPNAPKFQSIGSSAFRGCTQLKSIVIPEGISSIGTKIFQDCTSLKSVTLPKTLIYIANKAIFKNCDSLEEIQVVEGSKAEVWCGNHGFAELLKYAGH